MIHRTDFSATKLDREEQASVQDPLVIVPRPYKADLIDSKSAAIDLRLGTWFSTFRPGKSATIDNEEDRYVSSLSIRRTTTEQESQKNSDENTLTKMHYVPFGGRFTLHPKAFVLGVTLEWIRVPMDCAGYVTSRSTWGRRGLIIATAVGIHPGFSGCLTLELTNVGETPLNLEPGAAICQFFIHGVQKSKNAKENITSILAGKRKPGLGRIKPDKFAAALKKHGFGTSK